jgi:hypothetical protein
LAQISTSNWLIAELYSKDKRDKASKSMPICLTGVNYLLASSYTKKNLLATESIAWNI